MSKQPNKSPYVPLLVERLDIGESTAWLWLKALDFVALCSLNEFRTAEEDAQRLSISVLSLSKSLKSLKCQVSTIDNQISDCKEDSPEHRHLIGRQVEVTSNIETTRKDLELDKKLLSKIYRKMSNINTANCQYLYRRVQAAITSERTDWTPIEDVAGHLESQFGVTIKQIAEWYGYNPHSIYGIIGNGRFVEKRPKRALTLIDYYLKENELC